MHGSHALGWSEHLLEKKDVGQDKSRRPKSLCLDDEEVKDTMWRRKTSSPGTNFARNFP